LTRDERLAIVARRHATCSTTANMDWQGLIEPHRVVENVIRASSIYLILVLVLRLLPNRKTGNLGPADFLVVILLVAVVHGALSRDATSITDAVVMVATIVAWSFITDVLANRVPALRRLVYSSPVEVVRDGEVLSRNLRREFMTDEELRAQLRLQGVEDEADVAHAYIEHDGRMSVIRRDGAPPESRAGKAGIGR
jgi:uncharacterized membrane protein YcaP (DUF421 family)